MKDKLKDIIADGISYTLVNNNPDQEINVDVILDIDIDLKAIRQAIAEGDD